MLHYNKKQLKQFYFKCQKDKIIGLDTEFYRVDTYYAKLCLIQVSNLDQSIIIDPLENSFDKLFLKKLLFDNKIKKVIHASRQDLEIFFNLFGEVPGPVIDTQICLLYLGYPNSTSYAQACNDFLSVKIKKENQFVDWRVRPLSQEKIKYALNDVRYLIPLYLKINQKLNKIDMPRLAKDLEKLINKNLYEKKNEDAWERLKFKTIDPYELKILKEICKHRESIAKKQNIPIKKIIKDQDIRAICRKKSGEPLVQKIIQNLSNKEFKIEIVNILEKENFFNFKISKINNL
tara:strand:+ start:828 stop:1697 length:870 start_codon:yes stop_codon:yes gene_type:complete